MIRIESSWGLIVTDDQGNVIEKDLYEKEPCYLSNAVKFDIAEFDTWYESRFGKPSPKPSEFDVMDLGFWDAKGTYNSPNHDWRNEMIKG